MAKKSTTKKSKVAKTSKASTPRKSAASKTRQKSKATNAKRTTSKKAPAKTSTRKASRSASGIGFKRLTTALHGLRGLHLLSAVVYGVLIALTYLLVEVIERTVMVGYATTDALLGNDVLAPAVREIGSVDIRHALIALLAVGIIYSLYSATRGWKNYLRKAEAGTLRSRWVFAAITGPLVIATVALLNGVYDILFIALLAAVVLLATFLAYRVERTVAVTEKATLFLTSVVTVTVAVLALVVFIGFSMLFGFQLLPLHAYIATDIALLALLGYAVNQLFQLKKRRGFARALSVERNYVVISMIATVLFTGTIILGYLA